jgi:cobalamin synthase
MLYERSYAELVVSWGWILWCLSMCGAGLWAYSNERDAQARGGMRVAVLAQGNIFLGLMFSLVALLVAPMHRRPWLAAALCVGSVAGAQSARMTARKRDSELEREGHLAPRQRNKTRWRIVLASWVLFLLLVVWHPFSMQGAFLSFWGPMYCATAGGAALAYGSWTWMWARRKERHGHGALVIPLRRQ